MDIGTEGEPYVIEPLEAPIPNREPAPSEPVPEREPELIPA